MTEAQTSGPADAGEVLNSDVGCIGCGYNLRGLPPGGRCPECGASVEESLQGHCLWFANKNWLRKLRWAMLLGVSAAMLSFLLGLVMSVAPNLMADLSTIVLASYGLFGIAIRSISLAGIWLLTSAEPSRLAQETPVNLRTVVRAVAVAGLLVFVASNFLPYILTTTFARFAFSLLFFAIGTITIVGSLIILRRLAVRAHRPKLVTAVVIIGAIVVLVDVYQHGLYMLYVFDIFPSPLLGYGCTTCMHWVSHLLYIALQTRFFVVIGNAIKAGVTS